MKLLDIKHLKNIEEDQILNGPEGYQLILPKNERWEERLEGVPLDKKNPMAIRIKHEGEPFIIPVTRLTINKAGHNLYMLTLGKPRTIESYEKNNFVIDEKKHELYQKPVEDEPEKKAD